MQQTTLDSVPKLIGGFLGYTASFFNIDPISLQLYANPKYIARFVAYLQARGVGLGQITKHVSLARKVSLNFISVLSGAAYSHCIYHHLHWYDPLNMLQIIRV